MKMLRYGLVAAALMLAACNQQPTSGDEATTDTPVAEDTTGEAPTAALPEVDPTLLAASNSEFTAIEPSEVGVFGAPTVQEALAPLLGPEMTEGANVSLSVRENGDDAVADLVRSGLADDSVTAGHVRIEFRHEPDGWYPTNAYRRSQCARGGATSAWTTGLCP